MFNKINLLAACLLLSASATQVSAQKKKDAKAAETPVKAASAFTKLPNGLEYNIIHDEPGTKLIQEGSFVSLNIRTHIADSAMFDTYKMNDNKPIEQQLTTQFLGGFMEGFLVLSAGDSAILRMPIDSAFKGGQFPPFAKSGDPVIYDVKIVSVKSKEEYEQGKKDAAARQVSIDDQIIRDYLQKNKLEARKTESGLYYIIEKTGNGKHATAADKVKVHYKGTLVDGTTFDSSYDRNQPIEFPLSGVIKGWTEGIPYLDEGGKGKLLIPSGLAYGQNAPPGSPIKANDVLIFDVELLEIIK